MSAKIVHISDLHLGFRKEKPSVPASLQKAALEMILKEDADAIIISGDLAKFGKQNDFEIVSVFLGKIRKNLPALCVPGNTDYSYFILTKMSSIEEEKNKPIFENAEFFSKKILFLGDSGSNFKALPYAFKIGEGYYILNEDVSEKKEQHIQRIENYKRIVGEEEGILSVNGINFIGFDSQRDIGKKIVAKAYIKNIAGSFFLEEPQDGAITEKHLEERTANLPKGINIAVMHHPLLYILGSNGISGRFSNGEIIAQKLLDKRIQLVLCGHKHLPGFRMEEFNGNNFYVSAANTLFSRDIKKPYKENSFNIIEIKGEKVSISHRGVYSNNIEKIADFMLG